MLKKILSIAGKPGLYKLVSNGKNMLIVENLETGKRIPAYARDRIVSLGDIAMYTVGDEVPLSKVLTSIFNELDGKVVDPSASATPEALHAFLEKVLPDYDRTRVYNNDIKKLIQWYNLLINVGITSFEEVEDEAPAAEAEAPTAE